MNDTIPTWEELDKKRPVWTIYSSQEGLSSSSFPEYGQSCTVTLLYKKTETAQFQKLNNRYSSFVVKREDYKNQVNLILLLLEELINQTKKGFKIKSSLPVKISGKKAWTQLQEILADKLDDSGLGEGRPHRSKWRISQTHKLDDIRRKCRKSKFFY